jgi:hypothetical protein
LRKSRGTAAGRPAAAALACGLTVLLGACSSAPASRPTRQVQLTSGTSHGVWWGVWAWEERGSLCMAIAGRPGPNAATEPSQDAQGGACGFARTPTYPHFFDSGPGPAGGYYNMGPLPSDAVQIRVSTTVILPTERLPRGVGLPAGRYWVQIIPAAGAGLGDGTDLNTPQPLNAAGQPVPFRKF